MLHASKRLGQHLLTSRSVLAKIIAAAELSTRDTVLEIGPGTGILTRALADRAGSVIAVEKDQDLCQSLKTRFAEEGIANVRLICGDTMKIPLEDLAMPDRYLVVANIPYYLTSRLIRRLLEAERPPERIFLMVQREVALRITARPPRMNLLALSVQAYGKPEIILTAPPEAFSPPPAVSSALIAIRSISGSFFARQRTDPARFFRVIRAAFQGKRKTLENSLSRNLKLPKTEIMELLARQKLAGKRPETLTLEDWGGLVHVMAARNILK